MRIRNAANEAYIYKKIQIPSQKQDFFGRLHRSIKEQEHNKTIYFISKYSSVSENSNVMESQSTLFVPTSGKLINLYGWY